MENNRSYLIPLIIAVSLAAGLLIGGRLNPAPSEEQFSYGGSHDQKLQDILHLINKRYVDSVDVEKLFEETISDMLHRLDPHSNYISAEDLKAINESIDGEFGGVGIRFFIIRDTVCVTHVIKDSPSQAAGLKSGDKILKVDGENIAGKKVTNEKVMKMLKGNEGTIVKVQVLRNGRKINASITRGAIPVASVSTSYMIRDGIGFIRIDQFSRNTAMEFRHAAAELKQQGMKKLILDLRENPGGILTSATGVVDEFLGSGYKIVETRGQHVKTETYRSTAAGILKDTEVVVLINSRSASASEILAGAIQDNDRGTIVGRRSFGKGLVQEDKLLRDGSNIRLTIARYYTPTGRCIQKPYTEDLNAYHNDVSDRIDNGEMYELDSTYFVDSLKYVTPKGKVVYGGGGIMPDVFVPYDSSGLSWYYTELRVNAVFTTFAFDFVHGKNNKWKSADDLYRNFNVTETLFNEFIRYAEKEFGIKKQPSEIRVSKERIKRTIKAEIARQLFEENGAFRIQNEYDNEVQEALRQLK